MNKVYVQFSKVDRILIYMMQLALDHEPYTSVPRPIVLHRLQSHG
jgi:hypothetical protein